MSDLVAAYGFYAVPQGGDTTQGMEPRAETEGHVRKATKKGLTCQPISVLSPLPNHQSDSSCYQGAEQESQPSPQRVLPLCIEFTLLIIRSKASLNLSPP